MIDIQTETVITLAEAAKHLPRRRAGRKPHPSTLYRWIANGVNGIKLENILIGSSTCTSLQAMQRFFDRLTEGNSVQPETTRQRQREIEKAERELSEAGI